MKRGWSAIKLQPRLLRADDAAAYVGGESVLKDLEKAGWVDPVHRGNRLTLWDAKKLDAACDRLSEQTLPCWEPKKPDGAYGFSSMFPSFPRPIPRLSRAEFRALRNEMYERKSPVPVDANIRRGYKLF